MSSNTPKKITRRQVSPGISQRSSGEWCVMLGNKILSRHQTEEEASAEYDRRFRPTRSAGASVGAEVNDIPANVAAAMDRDPPRGFRSPWHRTA